MKNITVTVDDEVYHRTRVKAAELRTTVSALVREYLQALQAGHPPVSRSDGAAKTNDRDELVGLFRDANLVLGYTPNREASHER